MEHKLIVARNLRDGLEKIKALYMQLFRDNPLKEQWTYMSVKEHYDLDFHAHKKVIEDNFAWKAKQLFSKVEMARRERNITREGL